MPESKQIQTGATVEDGAEGTGTKLVPTRCIHCGGALDGSLEHVFNQALGGTKKSRDLYCSACNRSLGLQIDAFLAKDFEIVTTILNVRRDRGMPPTLRRTTDTGQKILIGPGGLPLLQGPTPIVIEHQDQQKLVTTTVPADRPDLWRHMLAKAAKELGVNSSQLVKSKMSLVTTRVGNIELKISVGGPTHERAIAKIALGFLALNIGDDVFDEPYAALRQAVHGQERRVWVQRPFRTLEASALPPSDGAQHRVIIYKTNDATWSHVEVYGTFGYAVLLSETPDMRFALPYVWAQNPTTGEVGEGRAALTALPVPVRELIEPTGEDWRPLLKTMWRISREEAIGRIVEQEFAIAGYQEGQEIAQAEWDEMWGRIAHQMAALCLPSAPIGLSRPIANVEEFEKIGRALRRCAASGDTER